jgi:GNAT superfamily N-acetyltransferase
MVINEASSNDVKSLAGIASDFASLANVDLDCPLWISSWENFIDSGFGVIFTIANDDSIVGMLGGVAYPDINSGKKMATEFFWYVTPSARGKGLKLFDSFEKWAINKGCSDIIMVHLQDVMPDKLRKLYKRKGYKAIETHYMKRLQ